MSINLKIAMTLLLLVGVDLFALKGFGEEAEPVAQPALKPAAPPSAPVEELVSEALNRSPPIAALKNRLAAAEKLSDSAGALSNPMIELMLQDVGIPQPTPMSMAVLQLKQELPYPGKRAAREDSAMAEVAVRKAEVRELRVRLATQVRTLYAKLYETDSEQKTLRSGRDLLRLLSSAVEARYGSGQAEMEALVKTRLSLARLEERARDLVARREKLQAALNRLLDRPGDQPIRSIDALPAIDPMPARVLEAALANAPMLAVRQAAAAAAQKRLDQARLEVKPDFSLGAGGGITYDAMPLVILQFGMDLPIYPSNREPLVSSAESELEAARNDLRDAEAVVRAEVARLISEWSRNQDQLKRYRDSIIPQANTAMEAARASYLTGRGDFSMVIEDFNAWLEARFQQTQREAGLFMAWAELAALTSKATGDGPEGRSP